MKMRHSAKIYEQVAEEIVRMIETGQLSPGDRLPPLRELAKQFGVSRATVREAFSALQGMGLIALRHGEGTFVQQIDLQTMVQEPMNAALLLGRNELLQLHEIREMLETGACRLAVRRALPEDLLAVEEALNSLLREEESELLPQLDFLFHLSIAQAGQNIVLINLMQILEETIKSLTRVQISRIPLPLVLKDYQHIAQSLRERDELRAEIAMKGYLQRVQEMILQLKKEQEED